MPSPRDDTREFMARGLSAPETFPQQSYFATLQATPSATANTYGTAAVFTPPVGFNYFLVEHFGTSQSGVGTETITVQVTGFFSDGTSYSTTSTYTSSQGDIDNQNYLEALYGSASGAAGLTVQGKYLTSISVAVKSSIASSAETSTIRFFGRIV